MIRPLLAALAAAALLAPASAGPAAAQQCGTHCGTERWAVKTLSDADRSQVSFTPVDETVAALRALAQPVKVTVTGVGFFEFAHGQTGLAPNAIELHPVLGIEFSRP